MILKNEICVLLSNNQIKCLFVRVVSRVFRYEYPSRITWMSLSCTIQIPTFIHVRYIVYCFLVEFYYEILELVGKVDSYLSSFPLSPERVSKLYITNSRRTYGPWHDPRAPSSCLLSGVREPRTSGKSLCL